MSFLLSALIVAFVQPILEETSKNDDFSVKVIFDDLVCGFKYVICNRQIYLLIALSAGVNFFMAGYSLLLPYGNQMFPKITGDIYATFLTAEAIGGVIGAVVSGKMRRKLSTGQLMAMLFVFGGFVALAPVLYFVKAELFLMVLSPVGSGIFMTLFNIHSFSLVQREVASEYLGRVLGIVFTVAILFMPLGTALFTIIFSPSNPGNLLYLGISVMILSLIFLRLLQSNG